MSATMIEQAIQAARDLFNLDEQQKLVGSTEAGGSCCKQTYLLK